MQTRHPFFDDMAKLATSAVGMAQGVGEEARTFWRSQMERMIADMDLVGRDEFEAMKALAQSARAEADALKARVEALEAARQAGPAAAAAPTEGKPAKARRAKAAPEA
jgi:BMFP domain-containing protein YqiC